MVDDTDTKDRELKEYREYLERLAESNSTDMFSNGGIKHASILLSIFFQNTNSAARVYCSQGFKSELVWYGLKDYLNDPKHKLFVLIENQDCFKDELFTIIEEKKDKNDAIQVRQISEDGKKLIADRLGKATCSFAVFDDDKFRFEYDPKNLKSFGSFYQPDKCEILIKLFDSAFALSSLMRI